jgi:hypothetical protein
MKLTYEPLHALLLGLGFDDPLQAGPYPMNLDKASTRAALERHGVDLAVIETLGEDDGIRVGKGSEEERFLFLSAGAFPIEYDPDEYFGDDGSTQDAHFHDGDEYEGEAVRYRGNLGGVSVLMEMLGCSFVRISRGVAEFSRNDQVGRYEMNVVYATDGGGNRVAWVPVWELYEVLELVLFGGY